MHRPVHFSARLTAFAILILTVLSGCAGIAPTIEQTPDLAPSNVAALADSVLIEPLRQEGASLSVIVSDLRDGGVLLEHEPDRLRLPASVQKLFVAADALLRLPGEFRFATELFGNGPLDSAGVLHGDLVVRGGWDPSLSGDHPYSDWPWERFDGIANRLHEAGLRSIMGDLVIEAPAFVPAGWEIGDLPYHYAPRIAALMWNDGSLSEAQQVGGVLSSTVLTAVWPDPIFWTVDHATLWPVGMAAVLEPSGPLEVASPLGGGVAEIPVDVRDNRFRGTPWQARLRPSPYPRALAGDALRATLRRSGISGGDSTVVLDPGFPPQSLPAADVLRLVDRSAPLDSLVGAMVRHSANAWAEQLAAGCGSWTLDGRYAPTWPSVLDSLHLSGGDGLSAADACGMARRNRMRARTVHELLLAAHSRWGDRWLALLAEPGQPGTLEHRMPSLAGSFHGKTGTLSDCRTLAGYLGDENGPAVAITVLVNQASRNVEPDIDRFVEHLGARLRAGGS